MNPDANGPPDDDVLALAAACDDALAAGRALPDVADAAAGAAVRPRLERVVACMRRLRQVWPGGPAADVSTSPHAGAPAAVAPAAAPAQVGRFAIRRELGRGGFGVVFLAHDPQLNRDVALKVARTDSLLDPKLLARLQQEARAAAGLDHANLVAVYEAGQDGPICYIASAYCPGPTLAAWLRDQPQLAPHREAARFVATLAGAVEHAHRRGIVHRDLKPANILLAPACEAPASGDALAGGARLSEVVPKITDFGLAKDLTAAAGGAAAVGLTVTGTVLGTPSYMAPEQARGDTRHIGPAADLHALGTILYELLTGRPPFQAESVLETLELVRSAEPVPPSRLQPKVPRDLETICLKCLRKEPDKRYASAAALAEDLRRFQQGEPIKARPLSRRARLVRWCHRNPLVAGLVAGLVGLALVGFGAVAGAWRHAAAGWGKAEVALGREKDARRAEAEQKALTEHALYGQRLSLAYHEWQGFNVRRAQSLLDACPPDLRSWEWHYLDRLCHGELLSLPRQRLEVQGVAFSPDGSRLATVTGIWPIYVMRPRPADPEVGEVKVWDAATGKELVACRGHTGPVMGVAFSPDGRQLATASFDQTARLWDAATGREQFVLKCPGWVHGVAFSPDGRRLATGSFGPIQVWDTATGQEVFALHGHSDTVHSMAFSPDGQRLVSGSRDNTIRIWDVAGEKRGKVAPLVRTVAGGGDVRAVAVSPDGRRFAAGTYQGVVKVYDLVSGQEVFTQRNHTAITSVAFSPDGRSVASADHEGRVLLWGAASGGRLRTLRGHTGSVVAVAFRHDGRCLATAGRDGSTRVWDVTRDQAARQLTPRVGLICNLAFSPDNRWLASAGGVGSRGQANLARLWNLTSDEVTALPTDHAGGVSGVAFSPDGKHLATASADKTIKLRQMPAGRAVQTLRGHGGAVTAVAFSPDRRWLASASADGAVCRWDAAAALATGGPPGHRLEGHRDAVTSIAFSADSCWLASGSRDRTVRLWEVAGGREVLALGALPGEVKALAISPDGRHLAVACGDEHIRVWQVSPTRDGTAAPSPWRLFKGHNEAVLCLAFSPDGRRLASGSRDLTVRLWDVASGQETLALRGAVDGATAVAFSPDGRSLAAGSALVTLWEAAPAALGAGAAEPRAAEWHRLEAADAAADREWYASAFHLTRLRELRPELPSVHADRGDANMFLGRWDEAAADFATAIERNPENGSYWWRNAFALLVAGHEARYREVCTKALRRFGGTRDPRVAYMLVRLVAIGPGTADDLAEASRLVEQVLKPLPKPPWYLHTIALAHYRAGRHEQAVQAARESLEMKEVSWGAHVLNRLVLALAYKKLHQDERGRRHYDAAVAWIDQARKLPPAQNPHRLGLYTMDWLSCLVLQREAERAFAGGG